MSLRTGDFVGIPVAYSAPREAAEELLGRARSRLRPMAYRLVNSYTFALADKLPSYHSLLRDDGINLPDGRPLVQSLNTLVPGATKFRQVRGPTLFADCLDRGRRTGVRHFFLGGTEALLATLVEEASSVFPGINIGGTYSPPFRTMSDDEVREQDALIAEADPDVVWVGLGTPKQDFEAQRLCAALGVTAVGVGAAFDFFAGTKPEAPEWVRRISLEWAFRLLTEPRRLWRRYLFGNTRFIYLVARSWARPSRHHPSPTRPRV